MERTSGEYCISVVSMFSLPSSVSGEQTLAHESHCVIKINAEYCAYMYMLMTAIRVGSFQELALEGTSMLCPILVGSESHTSWPPRVCTCIVSKFHLKSQLID